MSQYRAKAVAKTMTVIRCRSNWNVDRETGLSEVVPYVIIMLLLCTLSAVSAVKDPLGFSEMFAWI